MSETPGRSQEKAALAFFLRKAQWLLDDAANEVPGNRYTPQQAAELAAALEELAALVRETIFNPAKDQA